MIIRFARAILVAILALPAVYLAAHSPLFASEAAVVVPAPAVDMPADRTGLQKAVLAGGCFWGMQGMFEHVKGVKQVVSGYAGGDETTARYPKVSTGTTGHAESVEITYDPKTISYGQLLRLYFSVAHDPTQMNAQGPDVGSQYRSAIFYLDDDQKRIGEAYIGQINQAHLFRRPLATRLEPLHGFYRAEGYHQDYLITHPNSPYIMFNDLPKISNLQRLFPEQYQSSPVEVDARS